MSKKEAMEMRINLDESPRPQLLQGEWVSLNGPWSFLFDDLDQGLEKGYQEALPSPREIIVPFAYQTPSSGIGDTTRHDHVWYQKDILVRDLSKRHILHFEGADYHLTLFVNGRKAGEDRGAYHRMSFDITPYLVEGNNRLSVKCDDDYSKAKPRGKQRYKDESFACWYVDTTGIYKECWLEVVGPSYLSDLRIWPSVKTKSVILDLIGVAKKAKAKIKYRGETLGEAEAHFDNGKATLTLSVEGELRLWDVGKPELYDIEISLDGQKPVLTYCAFREIEAKGGKVYLNGHPLYQQLILDQGYWRDSGLTPPSNKALLDDIKAMMEMGFNGARKHQKVEDERFLYYADCLGYLVWAEMPSMYELTDASKEELKREWLLSVGQQLSHPCVICYVPFNESWGVYDIGKSKDVQNYVDEVVNATKALDPTRFVISNDGWEHTSSSLITLHHYEQDAKKFAIGFANREDVLSKVFDYSGKKALADGYEYKGQPILLTEYGGAAYDADTKDNGNWGYGKTVCDEESFIARYDELTSFAASLPYCEGYCYTQLSDVEQEVNGLLTSDRRPKADPRRIAAINEKAAKVHFGQ